MEEKKIRLKRRHIYHGVCLLNYIILIPNLLKLMSSNYSDSLLQMQRLLKVYVFSFFNLGLAVVGIVLLIIVRKIDKSILLLVILNLLSFIYVVNSFLSLRIF